MQLPLIEQGIKNRLTDVESLTSQEQTVICAESNYDGIIRQVSEIVTDAELMGDLENAVNMLRCEEIEAAYKIGLSDGLKLQSELNILMGSKGDGERGKQEVNG